jgi:D-alanine-D-alanine ligase
MRRVGLIFGGPSEEHDVSLVSAKCILKALSRSKWEPVLLGVSRKGDWFLVDEKSLLSTEFAQPIDVARGELIFKKTPGSTFQPKLNDLNIDVVFPIIHGTYGEDGKLQGLLDTVGIPYVGCGVAASALCMDKELTKLMLAQHQIPIVPFISLHSSQIDFPFEEAQKKLGLPLFVKPCSSGSSVGVTKVTGASEWKSALQEAFRWSRKVLVETAISGDEVEVAVKGNIDVIASHPGTFRTDATFYDYSAKYLGKENDTKYFIPAFEDESVNRQIQEYAVKAYQVTGCQGLARVDFFRSSNGEIFLNEINTLPGFTPISMYPMLWEKSGLAYSDLIDELLALAFNK